MTPFERDVYDELADIKRIVSLGTRYRDMTKLLAELEDEKRVARKLHAFVRDCKKLTRNKSLQELIKRSGL